MAESRKDYGMCIDASLRARMTEILFIRKLYEPGGSSSLSWSKTRWVSSSMRPPE
jgi:hypothetical protein